MVDIYKYKPVTSPGQALYGCREVWARRLYHVFASTLLVIICFVKNDLPDRFLGNRWHEKTFQTRAEWGFSPGPSSPGSWALVGMSALIVTRISLSCIPLMNKVGAMACKASSTPSEGVVGAVSGSRAIMNVDAGLRRPPRGAARVASIGPCRRASAVVERIANIGFPKVLP